MKPLLIDAFVSANRNKRIQWEYKLYQQLQQQQQMHQNTILGEKSRLPFELKKKKKNLKTKH